MNTLKVPYQSITELKKAPNETFEKARKLKDAVYIFNKSSVVGVVLTQYQYETMHKMIHEYQSKIENYEKTT